MPSIKMKTGRWKFFQNEKSVVSRKHLLKTTSWNKVIESFQGEPKMVRACHQIKDFENIHNVKFYVSQKDNEIRLECPLELNEKIDHKKRE